MWLKLLKQRGRHGRFMFVAGVLAMVLIGWASLNNYPLDMEIGTNDARFVTNFHDPEQFENIIFRWTTAHSTVKLPQPPAGTSLVSLNLMNSYPAYVPAPTVTLHADNQLLAAFAVPRDEKALRRYYVLVPNNPHLAWSLNLDFHSTTYTPPNDARELGVPLDRVQINPTRQNVILPALPTLLASFMLGFFLYASLYLLNVRPFHSALIVSFVTLVVAFITWTRPLEVLPFLYRLAAMPMIAFGAIGIMRKLIPIEHGDATGQPSLMIRGEYLPIMFAFVWWMLPIFQAVQVWDGASIGVGVETWILGAIALGLVLIALIAGVFISRSQAQDQRQNVIMRYVLIALALGALIHFGYGLVYAFSRTGKDFWILFKGAREWVKGGSLYDLNAVMTNHVGAVFKVPPFYGMFFAPFVFQDGLQVLLYYRLITVALALATAIMWLRMVRITPLWWAICVIVILLNNRTILDTIAYGQIDVMLLFLLTCALWALRSDRDGLAGAFVALGTLFKIYPVILLAFFVVKGRWRGLLGFVLGMIVYNGLSIALVGWEMHRIYLFEVLPHIGGTTSWVENQTISGFLARFVDAPFEAHLLLNKQIELLGLFLSGLISLGACILSLRHAASRSTLFALQYAQFLLLMVFAVPAAWMHYETLLILVFLILLLHFQHQQLSFAKAMLLALSFGLIAYGNQWSFTGTTVMGILTIAGTSYKFYGMIVLAGVLTSTMLAERTTLRLPTFSLKRASPSTP